MTLFQAVAMLVIPAAIIACAPRGQKTSIGAIADTERRNLVTVAELGRLGGGRTLYEALRQLRPWFLEGRGTQPGLSIDGANVSDVGMLRTMSTIDVCEVRLVRTAAGAGRAVVRPSGEVVSGGDQIVVVTRRQVRGC